MWNSLADVGLVPDEDRFGVWDRRVVVLEQRPDVLSSQAMANLLAADGLLGGSWYLPTK